MRMRCSWWHVSSGTGGGGAYGAHARKQQQHVTYSR